MPLTINVGLSRKVGEANYGSRGASVHMELEADGSLVTEPMKLQEKIRQLFALVRTSLAEELNGGNGHAPAASAGPLPAGAAPPVNGNGGPKGGSRPATPAQVKALYAIIRQQGRELGSVLHDRCQVSRPEELTLRQASQLIDQLKGADANGTK